MDPTSVIFDYGCVLSLPQDAAAIPCMAAILGAGAAAVSESYWRHRVRYDRADLTAEDYWRVVANEADAGFDASLLPELIDCDTRSWSLPNPRMLPWVKRLRAAGIRTAVLSNMPLELRVFLERQAPWFPQFDCRTYSCDVRLSKPDEAIYRHCLKGLDAQPGEVLFFDDRAENVEAAQRMGMRAYLYQDAGEAAARLEPLCRA